MMEDGLDLLIGERIGQVLNECKSRKAKHYKQEEEVLSKFKGEDREAVDQLLEDFAQWNYEDCRTAYCAGVEDGIRMARKILSV